MALNLPTFYKRFASAIVFAAIMLTGLLWNNVAFVALVCVIQGLCLKEYFRLVRKIDTQTWWPKWLPVSLQIGSFIWIVSLAYEHLVVPAPYGDIFSVMYFQNSSLLRYLSILIPAGAYILPFVIMLASTLSKKTGWKASVESFAGIIYIVLPMSYLVLLRSYHPMLPLVMIVMIWINDTMAYLAGSFIGKHPFSPISPNKTWEGVIGGALLTIVAAGICGYFFSLKNVSHETTNAVFFAILGLIVSVTGTMGDLLESKLKRLADVKDTGTLMPGHGGALDRFDSMLIATPFVYCTIYCLINLFPAIKWLH